MIGVERHYSSLLGYSYYSILVIPVIRFPLDTNKDSHTGEYGKRSRLMILGLKYLFNAFDKMVVARSPNYKLNTRADVSDETVDLRRLSACGNDRQIDLALTTFGPHFDLHRLCLGHTTV